MKCIRCGGNVEWKGPLTNLTHTECSGCGGINCQAPESQPTPKYCDDPDNCTYSDCPTAFCDRVGYRASRDSQSLRFATIEAAEFAIDWMFRELVALNPDGEEHYRNVARSHALGSRGARGEGDPETGAPG